MEDRMTIAALKIELLGNIDNNRNLAKIKGYLS